MSRLTGLIAADQGKEIALVVPDIPKKKKNDCKKKKKGMKEEHTRRIMHTSCSMSRNI